MVVQMIPPGIVTEQKINIFKKKRKKSKKIKKKRDKKNAN